MFRFLINKIVALFDSIFSRKTKVAYWTNVHLVCAEYYECSNCHGVLDDTNSNLVPTKYCPSCGAYMEEL